MLISLNKLALHWKKQYSILTEITLNWQLFLEFSIKIIDLYIFLKNKKK